MEFHEKLQELRKQKGLTQEELAQVLFVSRTAVSKWESGRGYPNIDSLKAIAAYFHISIDELLSGDELLTIAEEDQKQTRTHLQDLVFGLLDLSAAMFLFLPFFAQKPNGVIQEVSLLTLCEITPFIKIAYCIAVFGLIGWGIVTLALQSCCRPVWERNKHRISLIWNAACTALFIISPQPNAAIFLFVFLVIKVLLLVKKP